MILRKVFALRWVLGTLILCVPAWSQSGAEVERYHRERRALLDANTAHLTTVLTMDRAAYLPGEAAVLSFSIANGSFSPMEVFEPFNISTGAIELLTEKITEGRTEWQDVNPDPWCCSSGRSDALPTKTIAAGATLNQTFNSYDRHFGGRSGC